MMKKSKTTVEKPATTTKAEQPVVAKATKAAPKKTTSAKPSQKAAEAVTPKTKLEQSETTVATKAIPKNQPPESPAPQKVQTALPTPPTLTILERVGLTAGSIWHYLSEHGPTSVTTLVAALTEDEKTVQRSIGWLAQEDKITITSANRIETIALKT